MQIEPYSALVLKDGRRLAYLAVGSDQGATVFHFHGHGSSRLEVLALAEAAAQANVRVIAFDRPGIGRSDPKTGDRLLDWPADVAEAADLLGIGRFSVQGMSAGGPFALACAHALSDRVDACSLVSTMPTPEVGRRSGPPLRRLVWWVAANFPDYFRRRLEAFRPDEMSEAMVHARVARMGQWLGGEDLRLMQDAALFDLLTRAMLESSRQSGPGNRNDLERLAQPWGFDIEKITVPVFVWHGAEDRIIHIGAARRMAQALRRCVPTFYDGEGHFSVLVNRAPDLIAALSV